MKVAIRDLSGADQGHLEVDFPVIENGKGTQAVHDVVTAYMAAQRSGTACTKTRGEVAGSGRKPWRQKGTGRARVGSIRSPVWRGGGVVFGPRPRDFRKKIAKSTRQLALRKALSERLTGADICLVEELRLEAPKTRDLVRIFGDMGLDGWILLVCDQIDPTLALAARNLPQVDLVTGLEINTYQILRYDRLVFTRDGFEQLQQRLRKSANEVPTS
jgi:large subunit ribosomal protein L4